jgi:hypothetical protein
MILIRWSSVIGDRQIDSETMFPAEAEDMADWYFDTLAANDNNFNITLFRVARHK